QWPVEAHLPGKALHVFLSHAGGQRKLRQRPAGDEIKHRKADDRHDQQQNDALPHTIEKESRHTAPERCSPAPCRGGGWPARPQRAARRPVSDQSARYQEPESQASARLFELGWTPLMLLFQPRISLPEKIGMKGNSSRTSSCTRK